MRILMQSRVDLFDRRGGDTVQLEKTKEELEKLGVAVDVSLALEPDLSGYDVVHLFNLDRCHETYLQGLNAKEQGKKLALSTIHHRFGEIEEYERRVRYGVRRLINPFVRSYEGKERLKNTYRAIFDPRQRRAVFLQMKMGIRKQQEELLAMVDALLPNAEMEAREIGKEFGRGVVAPSHGAGGEAAYDAATTETFVIPNGVDSSFAGATSDWFVEKYGLKDFVLYVGRIEPRKNQLAAVRATAEVRNTGGEEMKNLKLVLVGKFNSNHPEYCWRVKREIARNVWISHIESVPYENIGSAFAAAKVHILASFFETTGLVNCEAGLAGCNVVSTTKGYCSEYLEKDAWYCDPYDAGSIRDAILAAYRAPRGNDRLKQRILEKYTWEITAKKTLEAYRQISN